MIMAPQQASEPDHVVMAVAQQHVAVKRVARIAGSWAHYENCFQPWPAIKRFLHPRKEVSLQ
jgi:hypothetical protein